jgi:hypothetical protein
VLRNSGQLAIFSNLNDELFIPIEPIGTRSVQKSPPISIERIDIVEGMQFISTLYQAILSHSTVELTYKKFNSDGPKTFIFHPYYFNGSLKKK